MRNRYVEDEKSFLLETTLSGKSIINFFKDIKRNKYEIRIFYTWLDSPEMCIERIKVRVANGGHDIHNDIVERRFYRSLYNFWNLYRHIASQWV